MTDKKCLACGASEQESPLLSLAYRGEQLWICPRHMPQLIHQPEQLVGVLPGAEDLQAG